MEDAAPADAPVSEVADAPAAPELGTDVPDVPARAAGGEQPTAGEIADAVEDGPDSEGRYLLKVDGEERRVSFDELRAMAQKGAAADKRFNEAAEMRREVEERNKHFSETEKLIARIHDDPLLRAYFSDDKAAFYEVLADQMEYENLPEEERKKVDADRELKRKASAYDEQEKAAEQERAAVQFQADVKEMGRIGTAALAKAGISQGSPKFAHAIQRWAGEMHTAATAGVKLTPDQAAAGVAEFLGRADEVAGERIVSMSDDDLLAFMDEKGLTDRFRKADAARVSRRPGRTVPDSKISREDNGQRRAKKKISGRAIARLATGRMPE